MATIFAGQFADADPGAIFAGIAVVGNSASAVTQGAWQYSTTGGLTWFNIGAVADGATALALSTSTLVRFVPVANFNGAPTALVVRGLDNTYSGGFSSTVAIETRVTVDTTTRGGTTPIAAATATISTTITAENDAPTLGDGTLAAVLEDTANPPGQTVATIFTGQFNDLDASPSFAGIAVVGNSANAATQGQWQYSTNGGANWFAIGSVDDGAGALALSANTRIRFVPVAEFNGAPPALVVRGLDNTYGGGFSSTAGAETRVNVDVTTRGGTTPIAAVAANLNTTITPVNDAPSFTAGPNVAINEDDGPQIIANWATGVSAGPPNESGQTVSFTVTGNTNAGLFAVGPTIAADGTLTFTAAANASGSATITIRLNDNGGTSNSGVNISPPQVFTITVSAINDAPTLADGTLVAVPEDTLFPAGQTIGAIFAGKFADDDIGATFAGVAVVGNGANPVIGGAWQYSTNNVDWYDIGPVGEGAAALALSPATLVRFTPVANYYGPPVPLLVRALDDTYAGGFASTNGFEIRIGANTIPSGGATPFAAVLTTLGTMITPVNDPPEFNISSPIVVNPVNPQPVPVSGAISGPPNEGYQSLGWSAISSDPSALPHPNVMPDGNGGFQLQFVPAPFRNSTVNVMVTATDSEGGQFSQNVVVDLVVGQVPPTNLQFEARPNLFAVPARDQGLTLELRTLPAPLAQFPLDTSAAGGDVGTTGQRLIQVYAIDGDTEVLLFQLPAANLDQLNALFRDLPDDRYRIKLKMEDGTSRLIREVLVRDGKPFDPGDEREQFVEPIDIERAQPPEPPPPKDEEPPLEMPPDTLPPATDEALPLTPPGQVQTSSAAWWALAPALLAVAAAQRGENRRRNLPEALAALGKQPWLRLLLDRPGSR